jgi:hypothetical protein
MSNIFEDCQRINSYLLDSNEEEARSALIQLLNNKNVCNSEYYVLINHLIRQTGLYPYMDSSNCLWDDRFIAEAFKAPIGFEEPVVLHREQSLLLKKLLNGKSIVVSAPTSFGKSFIIDAFIAMKYPKNIVIIVPTIALMDETRRRIYKKFSDKYKIITTSESELSNKNILIFPQERALSYIDIIKNIDMLIIDEFYKISKKFEKERFSALYKTVLELSKIAKQRYFLAPNITSIPDNPVTSGMEFINKLDFNTVVLKMHKSYESIETEIEKGNVVVDILEKNKTKTLIYAGNFTEIGKVVNILIDKLPAKNNTLLDSFSDWLKENYYSGWNLATLIRRGVGVHNGRLHRSLSQIQIKLFEEINGLDTIISTSSIIEGVNTSAEVVILWRNRNGGSRLNDFTYKNIIGRSGRMFKHFIGQVYLLEKPPQESNSQLEIRFPDELLGNYDNSNMIFDMTSEQKKKNDDIRKQIIAHIGKENYSLIINKNLLQTANTGIILKILDSLRNNASKWNGLSYLNSDNPEAWGPLLYNVIKFIRREDRDRVYVNFIKMLSYNWKKSIPELLNRLNRNEDNVDAEKFFMLEKAVTYNVSSLLNDITVLYNMCFDKEIDISPFIFKLSHAFLPKVVYQLEEFGLPRMISRKLHKSNIINFELLEQDIYQTLNMFNHIGKESILKALDLTEIEQYILRYFFEGITINKINPNMEPPYVH